MKWLAVRETQVLYLIRREVYHSVYNIQVLQLAATKFIVRCHCRNITVIETKKISVFYKFKIIDWIERCLSNWYSNNWKQETEIAFNGVNYLWEEPLTYSSFYGIVEVNITVWDQRISRANDTWQCHKWQFIITLLLSHAAV